MKVIIINGSARKGNTLTAIEAFVKGASEKNEIEIIEPDKLNIAPCKGCGVCQCSKGCVDKDDTNPTIDKIAAADMILFATPVYWWGMSAQLKLIIDKCYCRGLQLKNKKVWWKGTCGHEWQASVKARSNGEKCPICSGARVIAGINDLATLEPLLVKQWSKKNKIKPTEV